MLGKLIKKEKLFDKEIVYNIGVADNDNYFANNILVHNCKNKSSQQGDNLLKLTADYTIGLSGTLILNNPIDAFVPLKWVGAEKSNLTNFKGTYCVFGGFGNREIVGYKNLDILKEVLQKYSLRRTKSEFADLPSKTIIRETLEMDTSHKKVL